MKTRCDWANKSEIEKTYHDNEWGIPIHDDKKLFEMIILEGKQAGLSWQTILKKRESLRAAFDNFEPEKIAKYDNKKIESLLLNDGIIKNRLKVLAVINNAKCYMELVKKHGSFDKFLWKYVDFKPIVNKFTDIKMVPAQTPLSDEISRDLKKMGFKFVGSTIIYAFMQAVGITNDHITGCFCRK